MSVRLVSIAWLIAISACAQAEVAGNSPGEVDAAIDAALPPDAFVCPRMPCDILAQCGCSSPTAPVCDLDFSMLASGTTACRANTNSGRESTTCSLSTTCDAGYVCLDGRCHHYCDDDDDCPGAGGVCVIQITHGTGTPVPNAPKVCTTDCVPTQTNNPTCPQGWACHIYVQDPSPSAGDERYLTDCDQAGSGNVGAPCTSSATCRAGLDCITVNGAGQCRPTCVCTGSNCAAGTCPGGSGSCRTLTPPATIGTQTYGVCIP